MVIQYRSYLVLNTLFIFVFVKVNFLAIVMGKGFATTTQSTNKTKKIITSKEPKGRLIQWSPWPPANFQTRYPAFPLVLTLLIVLVGQWYISLLR